MESNRGDWVRAGYAQVVAVESCPVIASGPGRVVLGTFHHSAWDVCDVRFSNGTQLGVTARHPAWTRARSATHASHLPQTTSLRA